MFVIDRNTNARIVRLIARVGLIRQAHVCPLISLVNDQEGCFLIKIRQSLSRNFDGTLYVKMEIC